METSIINLCMTNLRSIDLQEYIEEYKKQITEGLSGKSLMCWKSLKAFRSYLEMPHKSFADDLELAWNKDEVSGLFLSSRYKTYTELIRQNPRFLANCFKQLTDESKGLKKRCVVFQEQIRSISGKRVFQVDCHNISKFLSFYHPDIHYIYNKNAFKQLLWLVKVDIVQDDTNVETYLLYKRMCDYIRTLLMSDTELVADYKISDAYKLFPDVNGHLLTQDFVYALHSRMKKICDKRAKRRNLMTVEPVDSNKVSMACCKHSHEEPTDYSNKRKNDRMHRIGIEGEKWVVEYEKEKLIGTKYAKKVKRISDETPYAGYDILSYTPNGEKMYIEVKTSEGDLDTLLGITQHELEMSRKWGDKYYLYRLYGFKESGRNVELIIIRGDLSHICEHPIKYWVKLEK